MVFEAKCFPRRILIADICFPFRSHGLNLQAFGAPRTAHLLEQTYAKLIWICLRGIRREFEKITFIIFFLMQTLIIGMNLILLSWTNWQHDIRNKHQAEPVERPTHIGKGVIFNSVCVFFNSLHPGAVDYHRELKLSNRFRKHLVMSYNM